MAEIVAVHGVWNYQSHRTPSQAAADLGEDWEKKLLGGYLDAGLGHLRAPSIAATYYAHLLRNEVEQVEQSGALDPDSLTPAERLLLTEWGLAHGMPQEVAQGPATAVVEPVLSWVLRNSGGVRRRTVGLAARALREVRTYLDKQDRREAVQDVVRARLAEHAPTVAIGHSLGSVVLYESLWRKPYPVIDLLVTLGSPLALPGGIFDRLDHGGLKVRGARPPGVKRWVNLAETGDLFAIPRPLSDQFDGVHTDENVYMAPADCHTMGMYLSCGMIAAAIAPYLVTPDEVMSPATAD
ncbi:hypothetical protein ACFYZ6_25970 [Streptomyces rubiginosohelvolus]|uniref:hypothetical protein n=1 Tax=Streptomyces rubiginosohelvolus TaxID=67362 RepID=UPI0033C9F79C